MAYDNKYVVSYVVELLIGTLDKLCSKVQYGNLETSLKNQIQQ